MCDHGMPGATIRRYRAADRDGVAAVCLATAVAGGDAAGCYSDDALMPEVFALPYLEYAPELAFVVAMPDVGVPGGERVVGYVLGVADTAAFIDWWAAHWTPAFVRRHPAIGPVTGRKPAFTEAQLLEAGANPERMRIPELDRYPAHLHIDLLPEAQGRGLGRRLVETLRAELFRREVPAVHLGVDAANTGARAFYARLGFHELPSSTPAVPLLGIVTGAPYVG